MGFRHKIGRLSKETWEQIKDLSLKELKEKYKQPYCSCYNITTEVYELGKYYEDAFLKPYSSKVFSNKEVHEYFNEEQVFILLNKKGLLAIIEDYRQRILSYYKSILNPTEMDKLLHKVPTPEQHIEKRIRDWGENIDKFKIAPYNLREDMEDIVSSWEYEYTIFELVRIYKNIDWDKELVTITAW